MNRDCVNQGGSYLSKDVLWVSVGQRAAKLQSFKLWGWPSCLRFQPSPHVCCLTLAGWQDFFWNLQLWELVILKPIDIKRPTVPLWKNLELVIYLISEQETDFQRDPMYLHRAHLVNGPIFFLLSVHVSIHMWLMGLLNPCELLHSWEYIFLKHYSHMNTKWALRKKSINGLLRNCDFKIFI